MYTIKVYQKGDHPNSVKTKVRKCVSSCLRPEPENLEEFEQKLASRLSQPGVLGGRYSYSNIWVWVYEPYGIRIYIHVFTKQVGSGKNDYMIIEATRRRGLVSHQELCLGVISESLDSSDEVQELRLPRRLQHDLREVMDEMEWTN